MPKMFLDPKKDEIPKPGDKYIVVAVYPNTTNELWRPSTEVVLKLERKDTKGEQK